MSAQWSTRWSRDHISARREDILNQTLNTQRYEDIHYSNDHLLLACTSWSIWNLMRSEYQLRLEMKTDFWMKMESNDIQWEPSMMVQKGSRSKVMTTMTFRYHWTCLNMVWSHSKYGTLIRRDSWENIKSLILGLSRFGRIETIFYRNSYRSPKCHIYETVKLNQIKLSNQLSYGESENIFKAFIEHDLDWTLIAQSYFLWQRTPAWWAQRLYVRPSLREQKIIVWLCVNSVCQSTLCESCFYPGRKPSRK